MMYVTAQQSQAEEQEGEHELKPLHCLVRIAQPLPLEVEPPHSYLRGIRRAALQLLPVLLAVDVGHQPVLRERGEGAARLELRLARCRCALVDAREIRGAHRLVDEGRETDNESAEAGKDELPAKDSAPASHEHGHAGRGKRKESSRMVRVAEAEEEANEHDEAIRAG